MVKSVAELKNLHKGKVIFVVGSGASIDAYDLDFFKDKIIVGCNDIYKKIKVDFTICTHRCVLEGVDKTTIVASEVDPGPLEGNPNIIDTPHIYYTFKVGKYMAFEENLSDIGKDDTLCMGNSIGSFAINFAAHLGASSIFLVGLDCCLVDGKYSYDGYYAKGFWIQKDESSWENVRQYLNDFFLRNVKEISIMRKKIKEVYGCTTVSLSPYIGLKNNGVLLSDYLSMNDVKRMASL